MHLRYRFLGTNKIVSFVRPLYIIINCLINFCSCYLIHSPLRISIWNPLVENFELCAPNIFFYIDESVKRNNAARKIGVSPKGWLATPLRNFTVESIYIYRARYFSIFSLFPLFQRIAIPTFPSREANQQKLGKNWSVILRRVNKTSNSGSKRGREREKKKRLRLKKRNV